MCSQKAPKRKKANDEEQCVEQGLAIVFCITIKVHVFSLKSPRCFNLFVCLRIMDPQQRSGETHSGIATEECCRHVHYITPHYTTHTTNMEIHRRVAEHIGKYDILLKIVKKKLRWSGHVVRANGTPANAFLHGKVEGKRSRGRPVVGQCKGIYRTEPE